MSPYPYSPFVTLRMSPLQRFPVHPEIEFGLAGFLCEQYRKETGRGTWKLFGCVVDPLHEEKYYEPQGSWAFVLDRIIRFGVPHDEVLSYFGFNVETFTLLKETASADNGVNQMYHFLPEKEWTKERGLWQRKMFLPQYYSEKDRLKQKQHHIAPIFGITMQRAKHDVIQDALTEIIILARKYVALWTEVNGLSPFDDDAEDKQAQRDEALSNLSKQMEHNNITWDAHTFATAVVKWHGR